jgi:hypothetical protein
LRERQSITVQNRKETKRKNIRQGRQNIFERKDMMRRRKSFSKRRKRKDKFFVVKEENNNNNNNNNNNICPINI